MALQILIGAATSSPARSTDTPTDRIITTRTWLPRAAHGNDGSIPSGTTYKAKPASCAVRPGIAYRYLANDPLTGGRP